jgi:hypothetical protein
MEKKTFFAWREGLVINLVSNAIAFLVGCVVAYLKHEGSEWVSPLLFGGLAWFITMGIWVVIRLFRNIPIRQIKITDRTLPAILRGWLDDIGLKVQFKKDDLTDFKFVVTTDGNWVISIMRLKESPEFHLDAYVTEQVFRYNNSHGKTDAQRFKKAMSQVVGKRLTLAEVTGKVGASEDF